MNIPFVTLILLALLATSFSAVLADGAYQGDVVAGELLVKFKQDVPADVRDEVHNGIGSEVIKQFHSIYVDHVKLKPGLSVWKAIGLYQSDSTVEYAEPVGIVGIQEKPGQ